MPRTSNWKPFLFGTFSGCLGGVILGVLFAGVLGWALWTVEEESSRDPLQEMNITKERLTTDETKTYIDQLANEYLSSDDNVGLVVGLYKDGQSHVYGYGSISRDKKQTPDKNTVFEIASIGKTLTATVMAEMHLKNELDWDTPIESLLPAKVKAPRYKGKSITLLDLATQSSGLPNLAENFEPSDPLNPYADYTVEDMYEGLSMVKLTGPIGKQYAYSNLGFGLLGHMQELKTKKSYEDVVVAQICDPLEMNSTRITLDPSLKARLAIPHDGGKAVPVWEDLTLAGAGSFLSSANDMLKYLEAHLTGGEGSLYEAMQLTTQKRRPTDSSSQAIGLGWHIDSENAIDIVWHNGGSGGSCSYTAFLKESQVGVVVLSNSTSTVDELGRKVLYLLHLH